MKSLWAVLFLVASPAFATDFRGTCHGEFTDGKIRDVRHLELDLQFPLSPGRQEKYVDATEIYDLAVSETEPVLSSRIDYSGSLSSWSRRQEGEKLFLWNRYEGDTDDVFRLELNPREKTGALVFPGDELVPTRTFQLTCD